MKKLKFYNHAPLLIAATFAVSLTALPNAMAQDANTSLFGNNDVWLGGGVAFKPKYEGSKKYEAYAIPAFEFSSPNTSGKSPLISSRGLDGIGLSLNGLMGYDLGGFEFGPLVGYNFGRDEDDAARLKGMGDVDAGITAGGYIAYRTSNIWLDAAMSDFISGDTDGMTLRLSGQISQPLNESTSLSAGLSTVYADDDYMTSFFGVSAAQSTASGLAQYDAEAGFKSVSATLGFSHLLSDNWKVSTSATYTRLVGDAADSPIVESENQFSGMVTLKYKILSGQ